MKKMLRQVVLATAALAATSALPLATAAAQTLTTVYGFSGKANGAFPIGGVTAIGKNIFGTTTFGGTNNGGTVFRYTTTRANSLVTLAVLPQPSQVAGALLDYQGTLYGITGYGGSGQYGELFSVNPATKALTVLHAFSGADGGIATAPLTLVKGVLYGTTSIGGVGYGNIFSYNIATKTFSTIHTFGNDAPYYPTIPNGGLVQIGNYLYGTTNTGGANNLGTVFKLDIANNALTGC